MVYLLAFLLKVETNIPLIGFRRQKPTLRFCFSSFGNVALINSIPVCDTLVERGLNVNPTCPTSANADESLLYLP